MSLDESALQNQAQKDFWKTDTVMKCIMTINHCLLLPYKTYFNRSCMVTQHYTLGYVSFLALATLWGASLPPEQQAELLGTRGTLF